MLPLHTQLPKHSHPGRSVEELRLAGVLPRRAVARLSLLGEGGEARCTTGDHESIITTARRVPPYYRAVEALSLSGKMPTEFALTLIGFRASCGCVSKYSRRQLFHCFVAPVRMVSQCEYDLLARRLALGFS